MLRETVYNTFEKENLKEHIKKKQWLRNLQKIFEQIFALVLFGY